MKKCIAFGGNLDVVAKLSENNNFEVLGWDEVIWVMSTVLPWCVIILTVTEKYEFGIFLSRYVFNLRNWSRISNRKELVEIVAASETDKFIPCIAAE